MIQTCLRDSSQIINNTQINTQNPDILKVEISTFVYLIKYHLSSYVQRDMPKVLRGSQKIRWLGSGFKFEPCRVSCHPHEARTKLDGWKASMMKYHSAQQSSFTKNKSPSLYMCDFENFPQINAALSSATHNMTGCNLKQMRKIEMRLLLFSFWYWFIAINVMVIFQGFSRNIHNDLLLR